MPPTNLQSSHQNAQSQTNYVGLQDQEVGVTEMDATYEDANSTQDDGHHELHEVQEDGVSTAKAHPAPGVGQSLLDKIVLDGDSQPTNKVRVLQKYENASSTSHQIEEDEVKLIYQSRSSLGGRNQRANETKMTEKKSDSELRSNTYTSHFQSDSGDEKKRREMFNLATRDESTLELQADEKKDQQPTQTFVDTMPHSRPDLKISKLVRYNVQNIEVDAPRTTAQEHSSKYKASKLPRLYRQQDESLNMVIFKDDVTAKLRPLLDKSDDHKKKEMLSQSKLRLQLFNRRANHHGHIAHRAPEPNVPASDQTLERTRPKDSLPDFQLQNILRTDTSMFDIDNLNVSLDTTNELSHGQSKDRIFEEFRATESSMMSITSSKRQTLHKLLPQYDKPMDPSYYDGDNHIASAKNINKLKNKRNVYSKKGGVNEKDELPVWHYRMNAASQKSIQIRETEISDACGGNQSESPIIQDQGMEHNSKRSSWLHLQENDNAFKDFDHQVDHSRKFLQTNQSNFIQDKLKRRFDKDEHIKNLKRSRQGSRQSLNAISSAIKHSSNEQERKQALAQEVQEAWGGATQTIANRKSSQQVYPSKQIMKRSLFLNKQKKESINTDLVAVGKGNTLSLDEFTSQVKSYLRAFEKSKPNKSSSLPKLEDKSIHQVSINGSRRSQESLLYDDPQNDKNSAFALQPNSRPLMPNKLNKRYGKLNTSAAMAYKETSAKKKSELPFLQYEKRRDGEKKEIQRRQQSIEPPITSHVNVDLVNFKHFQKLFVGEDNTDDSLTVAQHNTLSAAKCSQQSSLSLPQNASLDHDNGQSFPRNSHLLPAKSLVTKSQLNSSKHSTKLHKKQTISSMMVDVNFKRPKPITQHQSANQRALNDSSYIDLESPQRYQQIIKEKQSQRKQEALQLAWDLSKSVLDCKTNKTNERRLRVVEQTYSQKVLENESKFKQVSKDLDNFKKIGISMSYLRDGQKNLDRITSVNSQTIEHINKHRVAPREARKGNRKATTYTAYRPYVRRSNAKQT